MNKSSTPPVVCCTDFSKAAERAARVAAAMAVRLAAPLKLVHTVEDYGEIPTAAWPSLIENVRPALTGQALQLRGFGAPVEEVLLDGASTESVSSYAERLDAGLIVMAASSHGSIGRWILGSFSEQIAETTWIPSLLL